MATTKPRVQVTISADGSSFSNAMDKAKGKLLEFGATSKRVHGTAITDVQATSGALRLLDGGIQNNIRSAERYLASIKGVGAAMKMIYPTVGLIAVGAVIGRGVVELINFTKKIKEASQTFQAESRNMLDSSRQSNDELAKTNVELENQIAKLTGKHENVLAAELAQDRVEADKLAISAANAAKQIKDLLDKSSVGFTSATGIIRMVMGEGRTDLNDKDLDSANTARANARQDVDDALARGDQADAEKARQALRALRASQLQQFQTRLAGFQRMQREGQSGDQSQNVAHTQLEVNALRGEQDQELLDAQNKKDEAQIKNIQDAKNLATKQMEAFRQQYAEFTSSLVAGPEETEQQFHARSLASEADFWAQKLSILKRGTENYKAVQKELADILKQSNQLYAEAQNEQIKLLQERDKFISSSFGDDLDLSRNIGDANQGKDVTAMLAGMNESVAVANQNADAWAEAQISIGLAAGQISKYDAALQTLQLHRQQYDRATASISASRASLMQRYGSPDASPEARAAFEQLDNQQAAANGQYRIQSAQDQNALSAQTPFGAWKNALDQFVQESRDTASQVASIWSSALSSVNNEIVKVLSSRHNYGVGREFSNIGAGIFRGVASAGLQKGEGALLGALGLGGKADGSSQSKALWTRVVGVTGAVGSAAKSVGSAAAGGLSGFLGKIGGFFSGLGFAGGGMPPVGMASLVGERGPELFVPHTAGSIIPNDMLGGGVHHHWNIDARGATDPAAVNAAVNRAIAKAAPSLSAMSMHAQRESNARRAPSARR